MQSHSSEPEPSTGQIVFPNGNQAKWVRAAPGTEPQDLLWVLDLPRPRSIILLLGGAEGLPHELEAKLARLLGRGVAGCAVEMGALILDGGTRSGIMSLMGQGITERRQAPLLVGVAPAERVTWPGGPPPDGPESRTPLDEHHTHFVLVDSDTWGGESHTLFALAAALAEDNPVAVVLADGGEVSKQEALAAVRHGWPLVVLQGSGRLADELASLLARTPRDLADPVLEEILSEGNLCLFPLEGTPHELQQLLGRQLRENSVLTLAWQRFALYASNASRQQRLFRRLKFWSLVLGVLATLVALLDAQLLASGSIADKGQVDRPLRWLVLLLAASVTVLMTAANQFKSGIRWIWLRAHAEALKREIFRYRCRLGFRAEPGPDPSSRERRLATRMKSISGQLQSTEAHLSALRLYRGPLPPDRTLAAGDDGFSALTASQYIHYRLDDQLGYYRRKIDQLDRRAQRLQWCALVTSALGTVLAGLGAELWVPLTTALVTAITAWLGYQQAESQMVKYHQSATELENLKAWWGALSLEEQGRPRNCETLVDSTELILQAEVSGWEQGMREALSRLQTRQEKDTGETRPETH